MVGGLAFAAYPVAFGSDAGLVRRKANLEVNEVKEEIFTMSLLGNILWLVFGGLISGVAYILAGFVLCLTIIGIPFGLQSMKLGVAVFAPFGKEIVEDENANGVLALLFNVLWLLLFGWEIALAHVASAAVLAITIIGIPFAYQHIKLVPLSLLPFGRDLRSVERPGHPGPDGRVQP